MDARGIDRSYEEFDAAVEWSHAAEADAVKIFLPGFKREEIHVLVDNHGNLRTRGERPVAGNRWSHFQKDFQLPADCNVDGIRAKFENETLTITLPKKIPSPQAAPESPPVPTRPEPRRPATAPPQKPPPAILEPPTALPPVPAPPSRPEPRRPATAPAQKPPPAIPEPPTAPPPVPAPPSRPEPRRPAISEPPTAPPPVPAPPSRPEPRRPAIPETPTAPPAPVPAKLPPAPSQKPVPESRPSLQPPVPAPAPEVETHKKNNGGAATTMPRPADVPKPEEGVMERAQQRSRVLLVNVAVAVVVLVGITIYVWHTLRNANAGGDYGHGKPGARSYSDEM